MRDCHEILAKAEGLSLLFDNKAACLQVSGDIKPAFTALCFKWKVSIRNGAYKIVFPKHKLKQRSLQT